MEETLCAILFTEQLYLYYFIFHHVFIHAAVSEIPHILESNPHSVFGAFLNGKKLVRGSNSHLSFNRPLPTE